MSAADSVMEAPDPGLMVLDPMGSEELARGGILGVAGPFRACRATAMLAPGVGVARSGAWGGCGAGRCPWWLWRVAFGELRWRSHWFGGRWLGPLSAPVRGGDGSCG